MQSKHFSISTFTLVITFFFSSNSFFPKQSGFTHSMRRKSITMSTRREIWMQSKHRSHWTHYVSQVIGIECKCSHMIWWKITWFSAANKENKSKMIKIFFLLDPNKSIKFVESAFLNFFFHRKILLNQFIEYNFYITTLESRWKALVFMLDQAVWMHLFTKKQFKLPRNCLISLRVSVINSLCWILAAVFPAIMTLASMRYDCARVGTYISNVSYSVRLYRLLYLSFYQLFFVIVSKTNSF